MFQLLKNKVIFSIIYLICTPNLVLAQIKPDTTLGSESSKINSIDELRGRIEGGAIRGENLFHSFQEFSIREGQEVYFANPSLIKNIFSRVTGNDISEIFGTLGVDGAANLFFINPNGIIFGENTVIDVGGSFIATTAESVKFADGNTLVIRNRSNEPILTWAAPIGLTLENTSGEIKVQGKGHNLEIEAFTPISNFSPTNREIEYPRNIALIGQNVNFSGGIVRSNGGNIFIMGVSKGDIFFETKNWKFSPNKETQFGNVILDSKSLIDSSGNPGGVIEVQGNEILLQNGSLMVIQNRDLKSSAGINLTSNNLTISGVVIEKVRAKGTLDTTPSGLFTESVAEGKGGAIDINTNQISILNGGQIQSTTFGNGEGGDIFIKAIESLEVANSVEYVFSSIRSSVFDSSQGGNIEIDAANLTLINGGSINSTTFNSGQAGDLIIDIANSSNIIGFVPNFFTPSSIASVSLSLGNTGVINLNTATLNLKSAGTVLSLASSKGNAGKVTINASESIQIENRIFEQPILASAISSSAEVVPSNLIPFFGIPATPSGNGGDLFINTAHLKIWDGGIVAVRNTGTGNGGDLNLQALQITVEDRGEISASTISGEGGNISINSDRVELFDSNITASAGGFGNGGNIDIDTGTLLGLNSDITATAVFGNGGNIKISSDGVLGLEERKAIADNQTSDVDASSQFGQQGIVVIDNPQNTIANPQNSTQTQPIEQKQVSVKGDCLTGKGVVKNRIQPNIAPSPEGYLSNILSELTWQPGEEPLRADTLIRTPNGGVFAVNSRQLAQIADNSCLLIENIE